MKPLPAMLSWSALFTLTGCGLFFPESIPKEHPPLTDMVEPLELFQEPDDEGQRKKLPLGGFTGAYVGDARQTLESMLGESEGIEIVRIVENSPADAAGLRVGDLLLEARIGDSPPRPLKYTSQWREIELNSKAGTQVTVVFDRANRRSQTTIEVAVRLHPTERGTIERLREELRIGVVVRTATEVEAREAGLGPGGGAVIVGLARNSPWRVAGLRFGDLIVSVDGREVAHPEVILEAIGSAGDSMTIDLVRDSERQEVKTQLTQRAHEMREFYVPILFSYESDRGKTTTNILSGFFCHQKTAAAWRIQFLWIFRFGGGDADQLLDVDG